MDLILQMIVLFCFTNLRRGLVVRSHHHRIVVVAGQVVPERFCERESDVHAVDSTLSTARGTFMSLPSNKRSININVKPISLT